MGGKRGGSSEEHPPHPGRMLADVSGKKKLKGQREGSDYAASKECEPRPGRHVAAGSGHSGSPGTVKREDSCSWGWFLGGWGGGGGGGGGVGGGGGGGGGGMELHLHRFIPDLKPL